MIIDYELWLAPPGSGAYEAVSLADFTLVRDPKSQYADTFDFTCSISFDGSTAPAMTAGRIPGTTRYDIGARCELWGVYDGVYHRLFAGVITDAPQRDGWKVKFTAQSELQRLGSAIAVFQTEAAIKATFTDCVLRQSTDYPDGTLEIDPESSGQSDAFGTRGRRAWKNSAFILEKYNDDTHEWDEVQGTNYAVTPRLGLLSVSVDYESTDSYRLQSVSVYEEGTNEVEDNILLALTYAEASGGPGFDADYIDLEATGITISTLVQSASTGYVSDLIDELTGSKYAAGYELFVQYDYEGVSVGDPVFILGRNVYQDVPPPRTINTNRYTTLDQPTSASEISKKVVSTVKLLEPGNLAKTATITSHVSGVGWDNVYENSGTLSRLADGSAAQQYARYKESEEGNYVPFVSFTLTDATEVGRIIVLAGQAKTQRVTGYTVYGSNAESLPGPGEAGWEIIPGLYQVECKTAELGAGLIQPGCTVDVTVEDPRTYRHLCVYCKTYKWGLRSLEGTAGAIEIQIFGKRVKEFTAELQNTDPFGGQSAGSTTALTGILTFTPANDEVTGSGTDFEGEITEREIADGVAIKSPSTGLWYKVESVTDGTHLTLAGTFDGAGVETGSSEKTRFISTYKPLLLAALASLGPMVYLDDNETEETPAGAHLRAYEVLNEKSRFYQGVTAELAPDELVTPFETVLIVDTDHNVTGIPVLVEKVTVSSDKIVIEGVNYRAD